MQVPRRVSHGSMAIGGRSLPPPQMPRGRSSVLRRAGTIVGSEFATDATPATPPSTLNTSISQGPLGASTSGPLGSVESIPVGTTEPSPQHAQPDEPQCGLTPASLKHLKRQRDSLADDKTRLQTELAALHVKLREQEEQVVALGEKVHEAELRETELQEEVQDVRNQEEAQRRRANELEGLNSKLEESLSLREAELARMREALEAQRLLTKDVCEAAGQRDNSATNKQLSDLGESAQRLQREKEALLHEKEALNQELQKHIAEHADMQRTVVGAMAAAEKAMLMHIGHAEHVEQLRIVKLENAINQKVELHISVPRVTLNYNNAPPLLISAAAGLGNGRIREFLDLKVFPHFEPLWVRMDELDQAPDGSSKKLYSSRMLERLTEAIKSFILKSQQADSPEGCDLSLLSAADGPPATGSTDTATTNGHCDNGQMMTGKNNNNSSTNKNGSIGRKSRSIDGIGIPVKFGTAKESNGEGTKAGDGHDNLADTDRLKLLELLRLGDDSGLDAKLCQLLQGKTK